MKPSAQLRASDFFGIIWCPHKLTTFISTNVVSILFLLLGLPSFILLYLIIDLNERHDSGVTAVNHWVLSKR